MASTFVIDNGSSNRVWLMPYASAVGAIATPATCLLHRISEHLHEYTLANCRYLDEAKAITLSYSNEQLATLWMQDMNPALYTYTGTWELTGELQQTSRKFLMAKSLTGTHSLTSIPSLVNDPTVILSFVRTKLPDTAAALFSQSYTFRIGQAGGKRVEVTFGGANVITTVYVDKNNVTQTRTRKLAASEQEFLTAEQLTWQFLPMGNGEVLIICTHLDEPIKLVDVATIPPAQFHMTGNRGGWAIHLFPVPFPINGSITLPAYDFGRVYDNGELIHSAWGTGGQRFGALMYWHSTATNVSCVATGGRVKQITWSLVGDGWHTPKVQLIQTFAPGTVSAPDGSDALEISAVQEKSITLTRRSDDSPAELGFTIDAHGTFIDTLPPALLRGAVGVAGMLYRNITTRTVHSEDPYTYTDVPSAHQVGAFVGGARNPAADFPAGGAYTLDYTAFDPLLLFSEYQFAYSMCFLGATYEWIFRTMCNIVGIADDRIDWQASTTERINDPARRYDDPPWCVDVGSNAMDFLREFLRSAGLRVQCKPVTTGSVPLPMLVVEPSDPGATTAAHFSAAEVDFTGSTGEVETSEVYTHVSVIGYDPDGFPIFRWGEVPNTSLTPGQWGYVGGVRTLPLKCPDLTDAAAVEKRLTEEIKAARRPAITGVIRSHDAEIGDLYPWDKVGIADPGAMLGDYGVTEKLYKVGSVSISSSGGLDEVTLEVEEIHVT